MIRRITEHNRANPFTFVRFQQLDIRDFEYAKRKVSLVDEQEKTGDWYLNVRYGDDALRLHVSVPSLQHALLVPHGLAAHQDWMRLLRFTETKGLSDDDINRQMHEGKIPDRLVMVTRTPRAGAEQGSWAEVWRKDWVFNVYEFKPEGGFDSQRLKFPSSGQGEPDKAGELAEGSWQYQAALITMPDWARPKSKFHNDALSAIGWTLPAATLSGVVLLASAAFFAASRARRHAPIP